jgi:hypothetical protein
MKCCECKSQILSRPITVAGLEGFTVQGYVCHSDDCKLNGLPVLLEMTVEEFKPLEVDDRTVVLSETLTEPDYLKYLTVSLPQ